eukprot:jgi/Pico_ML_1/54114/g4536.t2
MGRVGGAPTMAQVDAITDLHDVHKALQVIEKLEVDAKLVADNVAHTSKLASRLSSRVKRLDSVQSKIKSTLARIDAILDRSNCLNGVNQAMDEQDYERAAQYVSKFIELDSDVGNLPFLDTKQLSDQKTSMMASRARLEEIVREKFKEAANNNNHTEAFRFGKLYPLLGIRDEGLQAVTSYVRSVVSGRARTQFEALSDELGNAGNERQKADFVGVLTAHFKDIGAAISENEPMLIGSFGNEALLSFVAAMHEECDVRGTAVIKRFCEHNSIEKLVKDTGSRSSMHAQTGDVDPREVESYLQEVLLLCERSEEYLSFILAKIGSASPGQVISPKEAGRVRGGAFSVAVKELISYYIALEEYYMEETVGTAIRISEAAEGSLTTSMVDDVFYILKKCGRRAIASGNVQCILATLSFAANTLTNKYKEKLAQEVRGRATKLLADAPAEYGLPPAEEAGMHAAPMNDLDVSAEYAEKLRRELEEFAMEVFSMPTDQDRIKSALSELGKAASDFSHMSKSSLEQLSMGILSKSLADSLTSRLDAMMMQKRFNPLGGLQFDKDVRNLIGRLSGLTQGTVRDKFSRLQQIAIILNLESVQEILDSWGDNAGSLSWRLSPAEIERDAALEELRGQLDRPEDMARAEEAFQVLLERGRKGDAWTARASAMHVASALAMAEKDVVKAAERTQEMVHAILEHLEDPEPRVREAVAEAARVVGARGRADAVRNVRSAAVRSVRDNFERVDDGGEEQERSGQAPKAGGAWRRR